MSDPRPVGVFDSGIGGLTVLAAIRRQLPHEHYLYLGDTARLPYGTKSPETVARYALRAGRFLVKQNIKMLVVACNTASAAALHVLQAALPVPVMGVVLPGARVAAHRSRGVVGVIATESTIASSAYSRAVLEQHPGARIISQACPLFVPLAEEGWFDHEVTRVVAGMYLAPLVAAGVDTVILGCTHYPLLRDAIAAEFAEDVVLVDSGDAVAEEVTTYLNEVGKRREEPGGDLRVFVTDTAERFQRIANTIIPSGLTTLELVDLPE